MKKTIYTIGRSTRSPVLLLHMGVVVLVISPAPCKLNRLFPLSEMLQEVVV